LNKTIANFVPGAQLNDEDLLVFIVEQNFVGISAVMLVVYIPSPLRNYT